MKSVRAWLILLAVALALPAGRGEDWVVVEYDGQTDWAKFDFVGWVRVEQPAKPARFAKGTAALTLRVLEKLAGEETAPTLTLEYEGPVAAKKGAPPPAADKHRWNEDLAEHREYFVFLDRLPNGAYWCGDQREFLVRDGRILGLPGAYAVLGNGDDKPNVRELIARAQASLLALRVRTGRPEFKTPLKDKGGRPVESPLQGFEKFRATLQAGDPRELERSIQSPDGSAPKGLVALLRQEKDKIVAWPVQWQAALEDKAAVVLGPTGQPMMTLYLVRRNARWMILNTMPDTEIGRTQLGLLLEERPFAILTAAAEREYRALSGFAP
jgi:hypothetical protein